MIYSNQKMMLLPEDLTTFAESSGWNANITGRTGRGLGNLASKERQKSLFCSNSSFGRIQVSEKDVLKPFALILTCNIAVLTYWTILDPMKYVRTILPGTYIWNRALASNGECHSKHPAVYLVPLGVRKSAWCILLCGRSRSIFLLTPMLVLQ